MKIILIKGNVYDKGEIFFEGHVHPHPKPLQLPQDLLVETEIQRGLNMKITEVTVIDETIGKGAEKNLETEVGTV